MKSLPRDYRCVVPSRGYRSSLPPPRLILQTVVIAEGSAFAFGVERDESIDLKEAKSRSQANTNGRTPGELRVVAINCNPAPDAQDRLRRLFTLLLEHTAGEGQTSPPAEDAERGNCNGR